MANEFVYQLIVEDLQAKILSGSYRPGDRLPTIRAQQKHWNCTLGTIQHAYRILAEQGLVTSHVGKGTCVVDRIDPHDRTAVVWRQARIVHQAEKFILESLMVGYSFEEIQASIEIAQGNLRKLQ